MCRAKIGFEPLVWESFGGMTPEISSILDSLCRVADGRMGVKYGTIRGKRSARISIDLQRGFHATSRYNARNNDNEWIIRGYYFRTGADNLEGIIHFPLPRSSRRILRFLFFSSPSPNSGWWRVPYTGRGLEEFLLTSFFISRMMMRSV